MELINQGRPLDSLSFSRSISIRKFSKLDGSACSPLRTTYKFYKLQVEMRQSESSSRFATNGRAVKMVPASEVVKDMIANGSRQVVNGANLVRRQPSPAPVRKPKVKQLPPVEELKVLPSDEGFSWANENYNSLQRSIDVWSFVVSLWVRVLLDTAKWAYLGGFTEEKQVHGVVKLLLYLLFWFLPLY